MATKRINGVPFTMGNKKLPTETYIFNMGTAFDCPSLKLGLCQCADKCYARKAELMYKAVKPFREEQAVAFNEKSASDIVNAMLEHSESSRKYKMKQFRFSEAGDFKDQKAVNKMASICSLLSEMGVDCYGYTARKDLDLTELMKFATVQGSGFMATNNFKIIRKGESTEGCDKICAGDCRICSLCWKGKGLTIGVHQH